MTAPPKQCHALLLRQLKRHGLNDLSIPLTLVDNWDDFLLSISRSYQHLEEDLYLRERSMTLSSNEMKALTEKLESIQHFARLGSWQLSQEDNLLSWSKETYDLTGFDPLKGAPLWGDFLAQVHPSDREQLKGAIDECFTKGHEFSVEIKFKDKASKQNLWLFIKACIEKKEKEEQIDTPISGIMFDITARKENEENLIKANEKMLSMSRQPGMAEIATYILHNIGNILNSANVSMSLLKDNLSRSYYPKLFKIITLLQENNQNISQYLSFDEKGKLLPEYLIKLGELLSEQHNEFQMEVSNISNNLEHINEIVAMQKAVSGTSGAIEKVNLSELIEYSLHMTNKAIKGMRPINIKKIFEEVPFIYVDKSKVLQILINLIQNATEAIVEQSSNQLGEVTLSLKASSKEVVIEVSDNGMGIDKEQAKRMFTFGFTTKKSGHGFGLHGSALLAKELGGSLEASSLGEGKGATFTLFLPKKTAF